MPQADDLVERAKEIYSPIGAKWLEQQKMFRMPGGGRIRFRPLENVADAQKYQGQNLSDAVIEEAGNYQASAPIDMLFGALRSKAGVPVQLLLTANPGGVGHQWIKSRYIDPAPLGMKILRRRLPSGAEHQSIYIPSKVQDNRILLRNDPSYVDRLHLVGSPDLVRAWFDGDWNVIAGAYFPEFDLSKHVVPPRELPAHWTRIRAFDWGSARPFCNLWMAVSDGTAEFPVNALIVYREWYGSTGEPNVGLRMPAEMVGAGILQREASGERIQSSVCDPAMMKQDGGPSMSERMSGLPWRGADNSRIPGWDQVRSRLLGTEGKPGLYIFSTCINLIRTLPALQHDTHKPEDMDSSGDDHCADALRYGCTSRPWQTAVRVEPPRERDSWERAFSKSNDSYGDNDWMTA